MKFDTPLERCPRCGTLVALDQTQRECAIEHRCKECDCPLDRFFTGHEFAPEKPGRERQGRERNGDG